MPVHLMPEQIAAIKAMLNKHVGFLNCPTSFGKTVTIYGHIKELLESNEQRICAIISGPIMDLNEQTAESVLTNLFHDGLISASDCELCICNSRNRGHYMILTNGDESKLYLKNKNADGLNKTGFSVVGIDEQQEKRFRLIVVCNPTLQKSEKVLDKLTDTEVLYSFYFDECQSIGDQLSGDVEGTEVVKENTDLDFNKIKTIIGNDGYAFFVSATPTEHNFAVLKEIFNKVSDDECFVYRCSPVKAIATHMILPPEFHIQCFDELNYGTLQTRIATLVEDVQNERTEGILKCPAKVLITMSNTNDLCAMKKYLINAYSDWDVFTTCSDKVNGGKTFNNDQLSDSISEFKRLIETNEKDCFIVHIKQIIAGVDIPSFTHAVFNMDDSTNLIAPIQITGRVLRPYKRFQNGEADTSLKETGKVYINVTSSYKAKQVCRTLVDYYGQTFEYLKASFSSYTNGSKTRNKAMNLQHQCNLAGDFDEYIEDFLQKLAISCVQDKQLGFDPNISVIVEERIKEFGYIPNLPKFYQPQLQKYVKMVTDQMNFLLKAQKYGIAV